MDGKLKAQILRSVQNYNILPVTSTCNVNCVFCSHKQNLPGMDVYRIPHLTLNDFEEIIDFLDPSEKITIGESATRIIEGEPFVHPHMVDILQRLRRRFPHTEIQVTTNGNRLTEEIVQLLHTLKPLEVNLSLNSACMIQRQKLMQDKYAQVAINSVEWLRKYDIPFHGSIVAMPMIAGWEDLKQTIYYFDRFGAQTIRIFMPGFTRLAPSKLKFSSGFEEQLAMFIDDLRQEIETPLLLEPFVHDDLTPRVEGVIQNSPAASLGIKRGDIIISINGKRPRCRVEAYQLLLPGTEAAVCLQRGIENYEIILKKQKGKSGGVVFEYDVMPSFWDRIEAAIAKYSSQSILMMTSVLAYGVIDKALSTVTLPANFYKTIARNQFFGGSIQAAGLLVVEDFVKTYENWVQEHADQPKVVFLPAIAFDEKGKDLLGQSYWDIEEACSCQVEII